MRVAVDTGGTFTDFVTIVKGKLLTHKVSSTPKDPAKAVLQGLEELSEQTPELLVHGTTVGTNTFLTRKGAKVLLITTAGFEDIIFIGRQNRPKLFDFRVTRPKAVISRSHVIGIPERISARGDILVPLNQEELEVLRQYIIEKRFESIAVCLLHSYANPIHERKIKDAFSDLNIPISISSEILPEFREFERTSTTLLNAYLAPVVAKYVNHLKKALSYTRIFLMQSSGGLMPAEAIYKRAVATLLSGPAAGVTGALALANMFGISRLITLDMGGTSTDVSLCDGGLTYTHRYEIEGYPVCIRMIDIHTIGAGGGSVASFDKGGALKVGPDSVGADPGPACYGRGGHSVTVTDANLVLGRLLPHRFLGGRIPLHPEESFKVLSQLASKRGFTIEELALGVIKIVNTNMEQAIKKVSVERGLDPQDFTLFCFGGAGGLHATDIASRLRMKQILIPRLSGVLSALGLLLARPIFDLSRSVFLEGDQVALEYLSPVIEELIEEGIREAARYGYSRQSLKAEIEIDLRYKGQSHELTVPLDKNFREHFHKTHHLLYGYSLPVNPLEVVAVRARLFTNPPSLELPQKKEGILKPRERSRIILYDGKKVMVPVYLWEQLPPEAELIGPVLIVGPYSTVWVEPGWRAATDKYINLWLVKD